MSTGLNYYESTKTQGASRGIFSHRWKANQTTQVMHGAQGRQLTILTGLDFLKGVTVKTYEVSWKASGTVRVCADNIDEAAEKVFNMDLNELRTWSIDTDASAYDMDIINIRRV